MLNARATYTNYLNQALAALSLRETGDPAPNNIGRFLDLLGILNED